MPAATPALSDSAAEPIGIAATTSQFSRTSRDSPLPSDPTTSTTGSPVTSTSPRSTVASPSRPDDEQPGVPVGLQRAGQVRRPRDRHPRRGAGRHLPRRRRHAGRPAGRHDHAVRAERGRRTAAPRRGCAGRSRRRGRRAAELRPPPAARASRSSGCAYSYGGTCSARPWWLRRRRSGRARSARPPSAGTPSWLAIFIDSRTRSSESIRSATYSAVAGTWARSASTTGLRPATHSGPVPVSRARLPPDGPGAAGPAGRLRGPLGGRPRLAVRRVAGPLGGLGRRALALELLAALAAGADGLALLRPRVALRAAAFAVAGHQGVSSIAVSASVQRGPFGVSSTTTPAAASASRTRSAAAQSLRVRGLGPLVQRDGDQPVDDAVQVRGRAGARPGR